MTGARISTEAQRVWATPRDPPEFARRLALALAEREEIERASEPCAWFERRYPTAGERLAYARRKYAEWSRPPTGRARPTALDT